MTTMETQTLHQSLNSNPTNKSEILSAIQTDQNKINQDIKLNTNLTSSHQIT